MKIAVLSLLVCLGGCAMLGREENDTIVMVEPGDVVEVVDEKKVTVRVAYKNDKGEKQEAYEKRKIAGLVAMPKSVYRKMRTSYLALIDFMNGKITEQELQARLKQAKAEQGSGDDQKANVPQTEKDGK